MNVHKITLICQQSDCRIKLKEGDRLLVAKINCSSYFGGPMSGDQSEPTAKTFILSRIVELAVMRELQVSREIDIVTFRDRLKIGEIGDSRFIGTIAKYRHAAAVEGETVGKDKGYPYKRWKITDAEMAKEVAKQNHWPIMRSSGKSAIKSRGECSNAN